MGVILNEAPEIYKSVIAAVPFVDVITTMLDDSIPLTTGEYDEWGNPNDQIYYNQNTAKLLRWSRVASSASCISFSNWCAVLATNAWQSDINSSRSSSKR